MKRIVVYVLLIAVIGGTSIWARNRDADHRENVKPKWGRITSEDSEGTLETTVWVDVDVDYPGERYTFRYGVDYEAYAKVHADWGFTHEGDYSLNAKAADTSPRRARRSWSIRASRSIRDKFSNKYSGSSADALRNWDESDIRTELATCSGSAWIDQDDLSYGSGSGSAPPEYESTAEVY